MFKLQSDNVMLQVYYNGKTESRNTSLVIFKHSLRKLVKGLSMVLVRQKGRVLGLNLEVRYNFCFLMDFGSRDGSN